MKKTTNKEKEYVYTMNLVFANIIAILIMVILFILTPLINKNLNYNFSTFEVTILFIIYFIWMGLHELLHGIGYRIGGAKKENVVYGVYLEKSILCTLCKQEIPKKTILLSLILPFLVIGVITYIIGMLINNVPLILLSILNLGGASMDAAMFIYILKKDKEIRYSESNNPTEFVLISKEDLTQKKNLAFKIVAVRDYAPKHFEFEKTKKLTISKESKQILIATILIIVIILLLITFL